LQSIRISHAQQQLPRLDGVATSEIGMQHDAVAGRVDATCVD